MVNHVKVYLDKAGDPDFISCEYCKLNKAVDIHHIVPRSHFGKKTKYKRDDISNLIALCRTCHDKAHAEKITKDEFKKIIALRPF